MSLFTRLIAGHDASTGAYHEWVNVAGAGDMFDAIGRRNGLGTHYFQRWVCNNVHCPAEAFVRESDIAVLLDATAAAEAVSR